MLFLAEYKQTNINNKNAYWMLMVREAYIGKR